MSALVSVLFRAELLTISVDPCNDTLLLGGAKSSVIESMLFYIDFAMNSCVGEVCRSILTHDKWFEHVVYYVQDLKPQSKRNCSMRSLLLPMFQLIG